jgi:hypothetical protein
MPSLKTSKHVYRLTQDDLVSYTTTWRFPLLRVPDLEIEHIYVHGDLVLF